MLAPFAWLSIVLMLAEASSNPVNNHVVQPKTIVHFAVSDTVDSTKASVKASVKDSTKASAKDSATQIALTQEILTNCIAVQKGLVQYWKAHADLRSAAESTVHQSQIKVGNGVANVGVLNYPALAVKDTALAGIFSRNKFTPQQFEPTVIATMKAIGVLVGGAGAPDPASVAGKNVTLVRTHRKELQDAGIDLKQEEDDGGSGFMGG